MFNILVVLKLKVPDLFSFCFGGPIYTVTIINLTEINEMKLMNGIDKNVCYRTKC